MLIAAGLRGEMLPVFMGVKIFLAAVLPLAYLITYGIPSGQPFFTKGLFSLILAISGFLIPSLWLSRKAENRKLRIFYELPDVLDLMTVCVEAGLSIDSSMVRIAEDREFAMSPLAKEMNTAVQETRAKGPWRMTLRPLPQCSFRQSVWAPASPIPCGYTPIR
jgi:tight adherence protein C